MHQFVESAIEAINQGDKNKALDLLKQVLTANPNDVDAWLVLTTLVDDPERKRQCIDRVLAVDPLNQLARAELFELDRATLDGIPLSNLVPPFVPSSSKPPSIDMILSEMTLPLISYSPEQPKSRLRAKQATEQPVVFRHPLYWRVWIYMFVAFLGGVGLLVVSQNFVNSLPLFLLTLLLSFAALSFSPKVEISEKGIRAFGVFSGSEISWYEIIKVKFNALQRRLELSGKNDETVNVSTQMSGFPHIVKILRQRRPDLFGKAKSSPAQENFSFVEHHDEATVAGNTNPIFSGIKTFRKSFMAQYGSYFLVVPLFLGSAWFIYTAPEYKVGAFIMILFCLVMICRPFFQVSQIKVEPDILTIETFFGEKKYRTQQIKNIDVKTIRSRSGRASKSIHFQPSEGSVITLAGFAEGDEVLYGFLTNWWGVYKNN
jgi:hypothetical protein